MAIAMTGGVKALCRNDSPSFTSFSSPLINEGAKMWMRCLSSALNQNLQRYFDYNVVNPQGWGEICLIFVHKK